MSGHDIRAVTAEMRRVMPNACGDWADQIDAAISDPVALRDYFAAKAMPDTMAMVMEAVPTFDDPNAAFCQCVARLSYQMADAMLVEREARS